jgi:hypothetical protein
LSSDPVRSGRCARISIRTPLTPNAGGRFWSQTCGPRDEVSRRPRGSGLLGTFRGFFAQFLQKPSHRNESNQCSGPTQPNFALIVLIDAGLTLIAAVLRFSSLVQGFPDAVSAGAILLVSSATFGLKLRRKHLLLGHAIPAKLHLRAGPSVTR